MNNSSNSNSNQNNNSNNNNGDSNSNNNSNSNQNGSNNSNNSTKNPNNENTTIFAAGGYTGAKTGRQIDDSGHEATQFKIFVDHKEKPVTLILGAYEPTIWEISASEGTKISKIILGGYHKQVISGINLNSVNVENHIFDEGSRSYFYISDSTLKSSLSRFGNVEKIYLDGDSDGEIFVGGENNQNVNFPTNSENPSQSYFKPENNSGPAGLELLVEKGVLRQANQDDVNEWVNEIINNQNSYIYTKKGIKYPVTDSEELATLKRIYTPRYLHNSYVMLQNTTLPEGLYGAHSATFFVKKGVSYTGDLGHSSAFDFNTLNCNGICYIED